MQKNSKDVLSDEILQEKAAVLGRAGESVYDALSQLMNIEAGIEEKCETLRRMSECSAGDKKIRAAIDEINNEIKAFNDLRDYAQIRYYYLIITREALGMRRHVWVEQFYRIPHKKRILSGI